MISMAFLSVHSRIRTYHCCIAGLLFAPALSLAAPFAYVTSWATPGTSSTLSVIDLANNSIMASVPSAGNGPIAANAAGTRAYVADWDNLSIIDTVTEAVVGKVPLETYASTRGVAVDPQGTRAYVAIGDNDMGYFFGVSVIDLTTNTILARLTAANLPSGNFMPVGIAINPQGTRLYVPASALGFTTDEVWVIDAATYATTARIVLPGGAGKAAMNAAGTRLYVAGTPWNGRANLSVIDTATDNVLTTIPLGGFAEGVAVNPAGTQIYVTTTYADGLWVIDAETLAILATVTMDTYPVAVAAHPDGTRVYVASSHGLSVVDTATNEVVATIPVSAPVDILVGPSVAGPGMTLEAVEYYHPQFEHYFVTADPVEIDALDSGVFPGWSRTGQRYRVYGAAAADRAPVCRFYTDAFAGKATHFYTASAGECEHLKQLPPWIFEGVAFHAPVPDASGECVAGTAPVYRLYNDGRGGAPNHEYTPDVAKRDRLIQGGWLGEGTVWCAPLALADPVSETLAFAGTTWELPIESLYGPGPLRTVFADELSTPDSAHSIYHDNFDLADPPATITHWNGGTGPANWNGYAHFEPLTGRFLIVAMSMFGDRDVWELQTASDPTSSACYFKAKQNADPLDPTARHSFQPVLWSGCTRVQVSRF